MSADLTPNQRAAVEHFEGPLLVLAGPGSGKTRVITRRIARLVEQGVSPREILAITFTNKAAAEMASRIAGLMPGSRVWVSTFHKFCARLLREHGAAVGLRPNFTIFDTGDQHQLIRQVLNAEDIDAVHYPPGRVAARISSAKNDMQTAEQFARAFEGRVGDPFQAVVARVYGKYQQALLESNAVDFDDLLLHVAALLAEHEELRRGLDERFRFILVDEYQDTNMAQYQIVLALSQVERNLCVTGDPDQSIYGWRGAQIENILRFERDFPEARVIRLEQNFRSTPEILRAADSLIANNVYRKAKTLVTDSPPGEPVELQLFDDGRHEAEAIADQIRTAVETGERKWSDFAIFYRVNALSRAIETALLRYRIPYQVAGGVAFYERAEIKDLIAYLRLIENPADRIAFLRVVNTPMRGIGKTSQTRLTEWAGREGVTLLDAAAQADQCPKMTKRAVKPLQEFALLISGLRIDPSETVAGLLERVIERTGYLRAWQEGGQSEDDAQHVANVQELLTAARQFDARTEEPTLQGFLETVSLTQDVDAIEDTSGQVTLMTLHAAKGLEFPVVYVVAVEQNLIPHERSLRENDPRELEEERRLLFVGMTRAMERLFLTHTRLREFRGRTLSTIPSDFLREIDVEWRDLSTQVPVDRDFTEPDESAYSQVEPHDDTEFPGTSPDLEELVQRLTTPRGKPLLMTGASLMNGSGEGVSLSQGFTVGMQVRHPRYGKGTVTGLGGFSKHRTVTVEFDEGRRETFVASKCPLQPIGLA